MSRLPSSCHKKPRNLYNELCMAGKGQQLFLIIYIHIRTLRAILDFRATGNFIDIKII
jgi:hypothetical protein